MPRKTAERHPREAEILKLLEHEDFKKTYHKATVQKAHELLDFFGKQKRFPTPQENVGLYRWVSATRGNAKSGSASQLVVDLLNLFGAGIEMKMKVPGTRSKPHRVLRSLPKPEPRRLRQMVASSAAVLLVGEMSLKREARTELRKLAPEGFKPIPGEDLGETVWWLRMWQWLDLKEAQPDEALAAFIKLQPRLMREKALSERQVNLVELMQDRAKARK